MGAEYILPKGRLVRVEFEVCLPAAATDSQVEQWLNLHMGCGSMAGNNPLMHKMPVPFEYELLLTDTQMIGRRVEYDHKPTNNGGVSYKVRYVRTPG